MDAKIPLTQLFLAFMILSFLSERKRNHADPSDFFARRKWTLQGAYQFVWGLIGLVFVYKVLVPLWVPAGHPSSTCERQAKRTPANGEDTDRRA